MRVEQLLSHHVPWVQDRRTTSVTKMCTSFAGMLIKLMKNSIHVRPPRIYTLNVCGHQRILPVRQITSSTLMQWNSGVNAHILLWV